MQYRAPKCTDAYASTTTLLAPYFGCRDLTNNFARRQLGGGWADSRTIAHATQSPRDRSDVGARLPRQ